MKGNFSNGIKHLSEMLENKNVCIEIK